MPKLPASTREMLEKGEEPQGAGRGPVDEGFYLCRVVQVDETEVKDSGYAGVDIRFEIVKPEVQGDRKIKGKKIFDYISYGESSGWKMRQLYEALGYTFDSDMQEFVDDEAELVVEVSTYTQTKGKNKNQLRNQVESYLEADEDGMTLVGD